MMFHVSVAGFFFHGRGVHVLNWRRLLEPIARAPSGVVRLYNTAFCTDSLLGHTDGTDETLVMMGSFFRCSVLHFSDSSVGG